MRWQLAVLSKLTPLEREHVEEKTKAGKTMRELFPGTSECPAFPVVMLSEVYTAIATHGRLGRDPNGRSLISEQEALLDRDGVSQDDERELWRDLWAAVDAESAAVQREEMEKARERR